MRRSATGASSNGVTTRKAASLFTGGGPGATLVFKASTPPTMKAPRQKRTVSSRSPERLGDLRTGPARQRQQQRPRPIRLPTVARARKNQKSGALRLARSNRRLSRHDTHPRISANSESQRTSVGQPIGTCLGSSAYSERSAPWQSGDRPNRQSGPRANQLVDLHLIEYGSRWSRYHRWPWRRRPKRSMLVANPQMIGYPPNLPFRLDTNGHWSGLIRKKGQTFDMETGSFYVGVAASHLKRLVLTQIPRRETKAMIRPAGFAIAAVIACSTWQGVRNLSGAGRLRVSQVAVARHDLRRRQPRRPLVSEPVAGPRDDDGLAASSGAVTP